MNMNCPNCNTYIGEAECIDSEFNEDTNCYNAYIRGHCSNCRRTYDLIDVYVFSHIEHIREVQPDD